MALKGRVKLSWEVDHEEGMFYIKGIAKKENGEVRNLEGKIELNEEYDDEEVLCVLAKMLKDLYFNELSNFLEGFISPDDSIYCDIIDTLELDLEELSESDLMDAYFDIEEIDDLLADYMDAAEEYDS